MRVTEGFLIYIFHRVFFFFFFFLGISNKKNLLRRNQTKYTGGVLSEKNNQFKLQSSNISKREREKEREAGELNATL